MLSIQAVSGLSRLRAPGIVPCIISFSRQLPCFLMVWPSYASFLALTVSSSFLFTPTLLRIRSFVFFAVRETRRIFLSLSSATLCIEQKVTGETELETTKPNSNYTKTSTSSQHTSPVPTAHSIDISWPKYCSTHFNNSENWAGRFKQIYLWAYKYMLNNIIGAKIHGMNQSTLNIRFIDTSKSRKKYQTVWKL